ncbi:MAG: hypothetical protein AAFQ52_02530 [Chloroflexota bacterium]
MITTDKYSTKQHKIVVNNRSCVQCGGVNNRPYPYCSDECGLAHFGLSVPRSVKHARVIEQTLKADYSTQVKTSRILRILNKVAIDSEFDYEILRTRYERHIAQLDASQDATPTEPAKQRSEPITLDIPTHYIQIDPQAIRAAYAMNEAPLLRLYYIMQAAGDGSGKVVMSALRAFMGSAGMTCKRSTLYRWIQDGIDAGYWQRDRKDSRVLYFLGQKKLGAHLLHRMKHDKWDMVKHEYIGTFRANNAIGGKRRVWVSPAGTLSDFMGATFAAWVAQQKDEGVTIAKKTLAELWQVSERTIYNWEHAGNVSSTPNYALGYNVKHPPKHAVPCGKNTHIWQMPNTYTAPGDVVQHSNIGNARTVRQAVNRELVALGFDPDSHMEHVGQLKRYYTGAPNKPAYEQSKKSKSVVCYAIMKRRNSGLWTYEGVKNARI